MSGRCVGISSFFLVKTSFFAPSGALIFAASLLATSAARAQVAPQVASSVAPRVVQSGSTISVPVATNESKVRLRLRNGAAYLDEETRKRENGAIATRLDAEPGLYVLRPFSAGKNGGLVGNPLSVVVPGLRREAGVWLFNGSLWIAKTPPAPGAASTFVANLRRDDKAKLPVSVATAELLGWQTVPLDNSGGATTGGAPIGGNFVGYSYAARGEMNESATALRDGDKTRARILEVDAASDPLLAARQLGNAARAFDAVVLKFDASKSLVSQLWPLKMARRMAEETASFDLPIFADVSAGGFSDAQLLEIYSNGATGFLAAPATAEPNWASVWDANSNWLSGAVTLEDMGVLNGNSPRLEPLLFDLRAAGRIPLVGQMPDDKNPKGESNIILLDDSTSAPILDGVKTAATAGNTVYLEGLPSPALYAKMGEITGTQVTALPAPHDDVLTLSDPWSWGALNGREFPITQRVSITVKQSLAAQTKEEKGLAIETAPRATAKLTGDLNGWMICPVGKGRIFWMPQTFRAIGPADLIAYYAAVAGEMQPALIEMSGDCDNVRVALRATQGQTTLLGLFNEGNAPAKLTVGLRGDAAYIVDLMSDKTLDNQVVGFETKFDVEVPARGYRWLALAKTEEDWGKEREFKRVKARLK